MYCLANLIRGGLGLLATIALAALLSGCILHSDELLVSEGEAATPLPGPFAMVHYEEDGAGYKRSVGPPGEFALEGKGYVSADGTVTVYFVPLETDTYLVALSSPDGNMYVFATYKDNVLDLDIVLGDVEGNADLKAIPGVEIADGYGVKLTDRAALDAVVALHQEGKLEMAPVIAYIGADANADFPAKLTPNGDSWTAN